MQVLLGRKEMQALDATTINDFGAPSLTLMEVAGSSVAEEIVRRIPDRSKRVLILLGRGNNGGDGLVVARRLALSGYNVHPVMVLGGAEDLKGDAAVQRDRFVAMGGTIGKVSTASELAPLVSSCAVVVDAVFGTGLDRPVEGELAEMFELVNASRAYKVAVDIPSGISADSGAVLGCAIRADLTVTFEPAKIGQLIPPGRAYAGELQVRDIGIFVNGIPTGEDDTLCADLAWRYTGISAPEIWNGNIEIEPDARIAFLTEESDFVRMFSSRCRPMDSNKGTFGKVVLFAGSDRFLGTIQLASRGALAAGAGLIFAVSSPTACTALSAALPQIITHPTDAESFSAAVELAASADSVLVGSGWKFAGNHVVLSELISSLPDETFLVLDAEALNILSSNDGKQALDALKARNRAYNVILPHPGEAARLLGLDTDEVLADRFKAVRVLSEQYNSIAVLKGASTLISDGMRVFVNPTGSPRLSTGGSGDVLAGVVAGLLPNFGKNPVKTVAAAVFAHGLASQFDSGSSLVVDMSALAAGVASIFASWDEGKWSSRNEQEMRK